VNARPCGTDGGDVGESGRWAQQLTARNGSVGVARAWQQTAEWVRDLRRKGVDNGRVARLTGGQILARDGIQQVRDGTGRHVVALVANVGRFDQPIAVQFTLYTKLPALRLGVGNCAR